MTVEDLISFLKFNINKLKPVGLEKIYIDNHILYMKFLCKDNFNSIQSFKDNIFIDIYFSNSVSGIETIQTGESKKIVFNVNFEYYNTFRIFHNIYQER